MLKQTIRLWPFSLLAFYFAISCGAVKAMDAADEVPSPPKMKPATIARINAGDKLLAEGKWPQALTEYDAAKALEPGSIEPLVYAAGRLSGSGDPLLSYMALRYVKSADLIDAKDSRNILANALAQQRLNNKKEALALFEQVHALILADKNNKGDEAMLVESMIKHVQHEIAATKPAPVKVEDRHYQMSNVAAVYISTGAVCKLAIYGGHDPDGGKQDGTNDGIIEFKKENVNTPDKVYRRKKDN